MVLRILPLFPLFLSLAFARQNLPRLIRKVRPAVVTVHTYDSEGRDLIQGSAFFVSRDGMLVTSRHVVHGAAKVLITTDDGRNYPARVRSENASDDLALLSADRKACSGVLALRTRIPEVGEDVLVVGSPLGFSDSAAVGIISAVRRVPGMGIVLQMTAPISAGSSGSPVLNSKGEVIGVARSQRGEGQNVNFAVPAERIHVLRTDAVPAPESARGPEAAKETPLGRAR